MLLRQLKYYLQIFARRPIRVARNSSAAMPDLIAAQDFTARQLCIHCKGGECVDDIVKEDAMVICDCCLDHGAHLKCLLKNGVGLSSEEIANPSFVWFCSEVSFLSVAKYTFQEFLSPKDVSDVFRKLPFVFGLSCRLARELPQA